jgi:hypothetical protein
MINLKQWLLKHNEYIPLAAAVILFWFSPYLLRMIDPTAGTYDVGVLQVNITAIIAFCIFQAVVWMALKINWLAIRCYFEDQFINDFNTLTSWQRISVSLSVYFLLLYALVLLSRVI